MTLPRPHMSLAVKLRAAILQLGLDPDSIDWDHDPALGLRLYNKENGKYDPDANDPRFITVRARSRDDEGHRAKTFGKGGTTAGSDIHRIAKIKRLAKAREALDQALSSKLTGEPQTPKKPNKIWGSRPWPKGRKMEGRGFEKRAKQTFSPF